MEPKPVIENTNNLIGKIKVTRPPNTIGFKEIKCKISGFNLKIRLTIWNKTNKDLNDPNKIDQNKCYTVLS